ncbi:RNA polymerase sigma factor [Tunicatimonas pelagia]|uniref:RNA polymerase sigma factor n=1 Tax=Tunicatimonas pelagia TaxID=931531 RepID=UPI0026651DD3|nr:sigma-70 family RNA polymerase sigma factor [Tunicatimonas pelagia]WKN45432.1 sigma-70 family RNA polymerase sigma factor [Tunicatimonas pelagia]
MSALPFTQPNTESLQTSQTLSDTQIWTNFKQGNEEAYHYIYTTYFPVLYNYGRQFCPNREQVKDCVQEVFITLWQSKKELSDTSSIKYYLFKSLKRSIARSEKKLRKRQQLVAQTPPFEIVSSIEENIISSQRATESKEKIQQAVNALSPRQREVIFLLFYESLTYPQIADLLTIEVKTARNLVGKALQTLRKSITFPFFLGMVVLLDWLFGST